MRSITLSEGDSDLVVAALEGDASDPIKLMRDAGGDVGTFFEYGDWRGVDFRKSDLQGVSFFQADLRGAILAPRQWDLIRNTLPKRLDQRPAEQPLLGNASSPLNVGVAAVSVPIISNEHEEIVSSEVDLLASAWRYLSKLVLEFEVGKKTREIAQYRATMALSIGCSKRTLDAWLKDEGLVLSKKLSDDPHVAGIIRLYRELSQELTIDWTLAQSFAASLELSSQDSAVLSAYEGEYIMVRPGVDGAILGDLTISNGNGASPWCFEISTKQSEGEVVSDNKQRGLVFHVNGRIHFIGAGLVGGRKYVKTMIVQASDIPGKELMHGILLSETSTVHTPFASRFALVPKAHPRLSDDHFIAQLVEELSTTSELRGGILKS